MNRIKMFALGTSLFVVGIMSAAPKRNEQPVPVKSKQVVVNSNKQVRHFGNLNQPQSRK